MRLEYGFLALGRGFWVVVLMELDGLLVVWIVAAMISG